MPTTKVVPKSKATGPNPKDIIGAQKISITKIPSTALLHEAHAMMNGGIKYDPYNWRAKPVQASIYVDAALRHLFDWFEGAEYASDSDVHHLGHARACLGILLDCLETGNLIDDRPICGNPDKFNQLQETLAARFKKWLSEYEKKRATK